jgi:hypothetical protein
MDIMFWCSANWRRDTNVAYPLVTMYNIHIYLCQFFNRVNWSKCLNLCVWTTELSPLTMLVLCFQHCRLITSSWVTFCFERSWHCLLHEAGQKDGSLGAKFTLFIFCTHLEKFQIETWLDLRLRAPGYTIV